MSYQTTWRFGYGSKEYFLLIIICLYFLTAVRHKNLFYV